MLPIRQYFTRRLTWQETTGAIVVVAILTGLGYLAYNFITAQMLEARVNAAIPKVCGSIRDQRQK